MGRVGVLANSKNNVIKVTPSDKDQTVTLSVESQDVGSGSETLPATIGGKATPFALNLKYALDPVKSLPSGEITLYINKPTQPILIKPLSGAPITHLVMPVQLRD